MPRLLTVPRPAQAIVLQRHAINSKVEVQKALIFIEYDKDDVIETEIGN